MLQEVIAPFHFTKDHGGIYSNETAIRTIRAIKIKSGRHIEDEASASHKTIGWRYAFRQFLQGYYRNAIFSFIFTLLLLQFFIIFFGLNKINLPPLLSQRTLISYKGPLKIIYHAHTLSVSLICPVTSPYFFLVKFRLKTHQHPSWISEGPLIVHYEVLPIKLINNIVPLSERFHNLEPEVVSQLRLRHFLAIVTPEILRVDTFILGHVIEVYVRIYGVIVVYPRAIYHRKRQIFISRMSHFRQIWNLLVNKNRLAKWLVHGRSLVV